jgi:hypothetical protein
MGGPEMAPQTPQHSSRPGGAVALLDLAPRAWAPKWPPNPPLTRSGGTYRSGNLPYPILGIDDFAEAAREASVNARGMPLRGMHARARSREQAYTENLLNPVQSLIVVAPRARKNRG